MRTEEERYGISCDLRRSIRYHRARERFFEGWTNSLSFVSLLAGFSVVVSLLADAPDWMTLSAGGCVALAQAAGQMFRPSSKMRDHAVFAGEFTNLERGLAVRGEVSDEDLRALRSEILAIEAREPPIKRYLDLICHNQVAVALGSDDLERLNFWQRMFAQYLPGDGALQSQASRAG